MISYTKAGPDGALYTAEADGTVRGQSGEVWHPSGDTMRRLARIREDMARAKRAWKICMARPCSAGEWRV